MYALDNLLFFVWLSIYLQILILFCLVSDYCCQPNYDLFLPFYVLGMTVFICAIHLVSLTCRFAFRFLGLRSVALRLICYFLTLIIFMVFTGQLVEDRLETDHTTVVVSKPVSLTTRLVILISKRRRWSTTLQECFIGLQLAHLKIVFWYWSFLLSSIWAEIVNNLFDVLGSKSSSHDSFEWSRRGVSLCWSWLAVDRITESSHASPGLQFSLSRAQARGYRWFSRLHPTRMENASKPAQNFSAQCKKFFQFQKSS